MTTLLRFIVDRFLVLPLGAAIALVWANTAGESYFRTAHALAFPVNEIGMAFFLALMTQEVIEGVIPGGALHTWRRWGLPMIGAVGGALGAIGVYLFVVGVKHEDVLTAAWPVAVAVDVAAGYYILKVIKPPHGAIPFMLLVAFGIDALVIAVLTFWPARLEPTMTSAILMFAALALALILRRRRVVAFWPYMTVCGTLSWLALFLTGIHPALALVPIAAFLPHRARGDNLFADPSAENAVRQTEHRWNYAVQGVLFLFGLVNAGVLMTAYDTGTWAVLAAALVGRPGGIVAAVGIAVAAGWHLPRPMTWRDLIVVAFATSCGFTFALFVATSLLPMGGVLTQIKAGALSTALGALAPVVAARLLRVGRFGHNTTAPQGYSRVPRTAH
jgi:Na+:H+ antiporter, NhaA family